MGITASLSKGLDLTSDALKRTMEFQKVKFFELFKYYIISFLIGIAGVVVMAIPLAILFFLVASSIAVGWIALVGAVLLGIVALAIIVVAAVFSTSVILASIRYVMSGQKEAYLQNRDYKPSLGYVLFYGIVVGAAYVLLLGIPLFLLFGSMLAPLLSQNNSAAAAGLMVGGAMLGYVLLFVGALIFVVFMALFSLAFVYGIYEIAAEGLAPVAALKRSYALLKANFWETIAFMVIMIGVGYAIGLASNVIILPLVLISVFFPPFLIISIPLLVVVSLATRVLMVPLYVFFWQKIRSAQV
jgi:hypothetical protein